MRNTFTARYELNNLDVSQIIAFFEGFFFILKSNLILSAKNFLASPPHESIFFFVCLCCNFI